jgi:glycosyltransferase involved in cell wall biosynthesis
MSSCRESRPDVRILLVTHYYASHRGGVEMVAEQLARRLVARHADLGVTWVASDEGVPAPADGVVRIPVPAWNVTERRLGFPYPLWSPAAIARIVRLVNQADVVHLHDSLYQGNVAAYVAARRRGKPVLVTQHIGPVPYSNPLLRGLLGLANRTLARAVLGGCDQAVFVSPRVLRYFAGLCRYRRPPLHLANGVDVGLFFPVAPDQRARVRARLGLADGCRVRLFVGRFVEKKGLPLLRELARRAPSDLFVFVGWGPDDPARWGLANVRAVGALPQSALADYYVGADLLLLPSVGEGFPLVVQEAMACGLPALISPETMEGAPDAAAVIASAPLEVESWLEAIRRLDAMPAEQQRDAATRFAGRWNWDEVADRYAEVLAAAFSTSAQSRRRR